MRLLRTLALMAPALALLGTSSTVSISSGVVQRTRPVVPGVVGEPAFAVQGAFGGSTAPVVLVVTESTDDTDACSGSGDTQTCTKCDTTFDNDCSYREAMLYPAPRVVLFNLSDGNPILLDSDVEPQAKHSHVLVDGGTNSYPVQIGHFMGYRPAVGMRDIIIRNITFLVAGDGYDAVGKRTTYVGCNDTRQYCVSSSDNATNPAGPPLDTTGANASNRDADDSNQCAIATDCDGIGGRPVGVCRFFHRSQWDARDGDYYCSNNNCDGFDHVTGSTALCSPKMIKDGISLDGIGLMEDSIVDRVAVGWSTDENVSIDLTSRLSEVDETWHIGKNIAFSRSVSGPGVDSNATYPGHIETSHGFGLMVNTSSVSAAELATGISIDLSAIMLNRGRPPWLNGGYVNMTRSLIYASGTTESSQGIRCEHSTCVTGLENNLFLLSPDTGGVPGGGYREEWGYCGAGADVGRICSTNDHCVGNCIIKGPVIFGLTKLYDDDADLTTNFGQIYLAGNAVQLASDLSIVDPGTDNEFNPQWDLLTPYRDTRPELNPGGQEDTTPSVTSYWGRHLTALPQAGGPRPDPTFVATTLRTTLQAIAGPAMETPAETEWWDLMAVAGEYEDQAFLPADPRPYAYYTEAVSPWADTDTDGISDAWENNPANIGNLTHSGNEIVTAATFPNLGRCVGYRLIECWAMRDAFGETITAPPPDGATCLLDTCLLDQGNLQ